MNGEEKGSETDTSQSPIRISEEVWALCTSSQPKRLEKERSQEREGFSVGPTVYPLKKTLSHTLKRKQNSSSRSPLLKDTSNKGY